MMTAVQAAKIQAHPNVLPSKAFEHNQHAFCADRPLDVLRSRGTYARIQNMFGWQNHGRACCASTDY